MYDAARTTLQLYLTGQREASWQPSVLYFEGKQDMLGQGQPIRGWTDIQKIQDTIGKGMDAFIRQRMEKQIVSYTILPRNPVNEAYARKSQLWLVKFSDHLPIDGEIRIYADRVAVITFHEARPVGFAFRGPLISSVFRAIFEHAWQST